MIRYVPVLGLCLMSLSGCNLVLDLDQFTEPGADAGPPPLWVRGNVLELTFNDGMTIDSSGLQQVVNPRNGAVAHDDGRYGKAYDFAATAANERLDVADHESLDLGAELTIEMWVLWRGGGNPQFQTLYGDLGEPSMGYSQQYWLALQGDGELHWRSNDCSTNTIVEVPGVRIAPEDDWVHIAVTWDASQVAFYRNAERLGLEQGVTRSPCNTNKTFFIGNNGNTYHFDGRLDEIKVSDYAKSEQQLRESMDFDSDEVGL